MNHDDDTTTSSGAAAPSVTSTAGLAAPEILTPRDAAALLKLPEPSVRSLLRTGRLPGVRFGALWRIRRADVERLFNDAAGRAGRPAVVGAATPSQASPAEPPIEVPAVVRSLGRPGRPRRRGRGARIAAL